MAVCAVNCTLDRRSCCSHSTSPRSIASYSSMIAVFAYPICIRGSPSQYCHNVWCEKRCGYPLVKKICVFVLTEYTNATDTQTDRQTPHDGIGRACVASRGKNCEFWPISRFIWEMVQDRAVLQWTVKRTPFPSFQVVPFSMTLSDS